MADFSFSIISLFQLLKKWKSKALIFIALLAIVTLTILFFKKNIYYSYTTAIPTNSSLNDKSYLFNDKIDGLYSSLGSYDDLARLEAIAELDTSYKYLIQKFDLVKHYHVKASNDNIAVQKAIMLMKEEYFKFEKTPSGLFRIHVWDEDAIIAAKLANSLMDYIDKTNSNLQVEYNKHSLSQISIQINSSFQSFKSCQDSIKTTKNEVERVYLQNKSATLLSDIGNLEKIKNQFETTLQFQQPSLRILDQAVANYRHVKPKRIFIFISTILIGLVSLLIVISIIESLKSGFANNE